MIARIVLGLVLAGMANAAVAGKTSGGDAALRHRDEPACLALLKKKSDAGDGAAAKTLAIHYGDTGSRRMNAGLALRYLKLAIARGVDVSDVPRAKSGKVLAACDALAPRKAAKPPTERKARVLPKVPAPAAAAKPSPDSANKSGERPQGLGQEVPEEGAVGQYERLAADAERSGAMQEAVGHWQRAREVGSRRAAMRLYQIYSVGAGNVEPDYVKAIEAADFARKLGIELPPLPRK